MVWDFNPLLVIYRREWYRLITGVYLHGGILHIAMNMFTMFSLGPVLEHTMGSMPFLGLTLVFSLLVTLLETAGRYFISLATGDMSWLYVNSVGFSGVLFSYVIMRTSVTGAQSYNLCGMSIPAWIYPWVMLIGISFLIPNASFAGHLSGLLLGIMYCRGYLNFLWPRRSCLRALEGWEGLDWLTNSLIYSKIPVEPPIPATDAWGGWSCNMCAATCISVGEICMKASDAISGIFRSAGSRVAEFASRRSPNAYDQLGSEEDVEVANASIPSAPEYSPPDEFGDDAMVRGSGFRLGERNSSTTEETKKGGTNNKPDKPKKQPQRSRPTPSGMSRLIDSVPRKNRR